MVEKLDQNDEKFYALLKQIEQNREADKEKTERYFEESNMNDVWKSQISNLIK